MHLARIILVAAAIVMTAIMAVYSSAQGPAPPGETEPEGYSSIRAEPTRERSFVWTEAAMLDAQPVPLPVADPDAVRTTFTARSAGPPESGATDEGGPSHTLELRPGDVRFFPLTRVGRLYFNKPDDPPGRGNICTAQFVASDVILTAAHCIQDDRPPYPYYRNFMFALQYEQGTTRRRYGVICAGNKKAWAQPNPQRWLYDYAMILTDAPSDVGWFGFQWNWIGKYRSATRIGYPRGSLKGEVVQVDNGPLSVTNGIVQLKHGNMDDQHGSSGGGYVGAYSTESRSDRNSIISLQSFSHGKGGETSGIGYGPYFTEQIFDLFKYVRAGCRNREPGPILR